MMDLDTIRNMLRDRRISMVAEATGLHTNTVANIRDGRTTNPPHRTVKALSEYLTETCSAACQVRSNG